MYRDSRRSEEEEEVPGVAEVAWRIGEDDIKDRRSNKQDFLKTNQGPNPVDGRGDVGTIILVYALLSRSCNGF